VICGATSPIIAFSPASHPPAGRVDGGRPWTRPLLAATNLTGFVVRLLLVCGGSCIQTLEPAELPSEEASRDKKFGRRLVGNEPKWPKRARLRASSLFRSRNVRFSVNRVAAAERGPGGVGLRVAEVGRMNPVTLHIPDLSIIGGGDQESNGAVTRAPVPPQGGRRRGPPDWQAAFKMGPQTSLLRFCVSSGGANFIASVI